MRVGWMYPWVFEHMKVCMMNVRECLCMHGCLCAIVHGMYSGAQAVSELGKQAGLNGKPVHLTFKRPMFVPAKALLLCEQKAQTTHFAAVSANRDQEETYFTGVVG